MSSSGKILNYGSFNLDQFFSVPHICQSGETLSSTNFYIRAGGKGKVVRLSTVVSKSMSRYCCTDI